MNIAFKRLVAFIVDVVIIAIISVVITNIPGVNPTKKDYQEQLDKYVENLTKDEVTKEESIELNYDLNKSGIYENSINMLISVLYFGLLPFFQEGQTIGKKILKIKIDDINGEKVSAGRYFLRAVILRNVLFVVINYSFLYTMSKELYYTASQYLSLVESSVTLVIIFMMFFRIDNRGLHDLICKTKVTDLKAEASE